MALEKQSLIYYKGVAIKILGNQYLISGRTYISETAAQNAIDKVWDRSERIKQTIDTTSRKARRK